jgi:hypothetical protein
MTFLKDRLSVVDLHDPELDQRLRALFEEARRRQRRRRAVVAAITGLIVIVLLATLLVKSSNGPVSPRSSSRTRVPQGSGVFARPTGAVLLFANGLTLDLDRGTMDRRPIVGQETSNGTSSGRVDRLSSGGVRYGQRQPQEGGRDSSGRS